MNGAKRSIGIPEHPPIRLMSDLKTMSWQGFIRKDGSLGIRNLILVVYTVECSRFVAEKVVEGEPDAQVIGFHGCYDNAYAVRVLLALARHPNVGAVLSIGLGCEYTQASKIAGLVRESGRFADSFLIQDEGGTEKSISRAKTWIAETRKQLRHGPRAPMGLADLTVGCECGGSDSTSGLAGNPVVGKFFDRLVDQGGRALFEETVEMMGLEEVIAARAADAKAEEQCRSAYQKAEAYCRRVRQFSVSPGNFAGGLTTIEEKSLGAFAKSGSRPIQGVIRVAEKPPHRGLWMLDSVPDEHFLSFGYTNPNDSEGITALVASGCHIVLFVTGRGSVIGSPIAPLLKITGNPHTFQRMKEDMDFDASGPLRGVSTLDEEGFRLAERVMGVAGGELSLPERLGHHEYCIPYKFQDPSQPRDQCSV